MKSLSTIITICCDFLPYIDILRDISNYHFTDFHRENSISVGVDIPEIHHIDELIAFLREIPNTQKVVIYTKFVKTIEEFIEFHKLKNIQAIETQK